MTDLEITRLCAEAMGFHRSGDMREQEWYYLRNHSYPNLRYDPLRNDAQAMALVKKFILRIDRTRGIPEQWGVYSKRNYQGMAISSDLNRAICECVAQMQQNKEHR